MTTFKKRFVAAVSAGSMFFSLATSVAAGTDITITSNGAYTDNEVEVELSRSTTVVQSNSAYVKNEIDADSNTGGNDASLNTGGDVLIKTGDAKTNVEVSNLLNKNVASVNCCDLGDVDVEISGNGAYSKNEVELEDENGKYRRKDSSDIAIFQDNYAKVKNEVDADATTGKNDASLNTGGDTGIVTGDAKASVSVATVANANFANVGGGSEEGGLLSAKILDNGAYTDNEIEFELDKDILIRQDNYARVKNEVDADAKTGYNDASLNTGGENLIATGDAKVKVLVDNLVNFNWADVDCGCIEDLDAKIAGNGAYAESEIEYELDGDLAVFQGGEESGNYARLYNDVDGDAKTGKNDLELSTGDSDGDPTIWTGDAYSKVEVGNAGNVNIFGEGPLHLPWDFEFDWDLGGLLGWM